MRGKAKILVTVLLLLVAVTGNLQAEIITINISATVTQIDDMDNLLLGQLGIGSTISGSYTYDSDTPDSNPSNPNNGGYSYTSTPYGISLTGGGYVFKSDPAHIDFGIGISNNNTGNTDSYVVGSANNLPLYLGVSVDTIHWQLDDLSGTALSSDALPTTAPVLTDWPDTWDHLTISGQSSISSYAIRSEVTSAELVPEPTTIVLLALGGLFICRRRK